MFSCVWLHFKKFSEKYFLVFGEEEGKDKPDKPRRRTARSHHSSIVAAVDRDLADWRGVTIALLVDRRAVRSRCWSRSIAMSDDDRRSHRSSIAPLIDQQARSSDDRAACRSVLSDLGSLFSLSLRSGLSLSLSLSLSLCGNDLKWKWGCKIISGSKVKISINRKPFSGKWNLPLLPNTWVWGKLISWNHFPPKQTHP